MKVAEYLIQNKQAIEAECQSVVDSGSKAIITLKNEGQSYIRRIGAVEEFTQTIPDDKFFKAMRDGINTAISHRVTPVVVFEGRAAKVISLPEGFEAK